MSAHALKLSSNALIIHNSYLRYAPNDFFLIFALLRTIFS